MDFCPSDMIAAKPHRIGQLLAAADQSGWTCSGHISGLLTEASTIQDLKQMWIEFAELATEDLRTAAETARALGLSQTR